MAEETTCGADEKANALLTSLTSGLNAPPTVDFTDPSFTYTKDPLLFVPVNDITLDDLTTVALDGTGVFDKLMSAVDLHIQREFKDNRITADQYAEVYSNSINSVLGTSVQFLLSKDQSKWNGIAAQMEARKAEVEIVTSLIQLESEKVSAAKMVFDAQNSFAQYGLTKINIANAEADHCFTKAKIASEEYNLCYILPAEAAVTQYQRAAVLPSTVNINKVQADRVLPAQAAIAEYTNRVLQPIDKGIKEFELSTILPNRTAIDAYQVNSLLPVQLEEARYKIDNDLPIGTNILSEQFEKERAQTKDTRSDGITAVEGLIGTQRALMKEQQESERAKTMDTRLDGFTTIAGSVQKQKDLYTQQIDSFIKDAKYKTAKMYLDGWITQKTLDDALLAPTELQNAEINEVLESIRTENNLGTP